MEFGEIANIEGMRFEAAAAILVHKLQRDRKKDDDLYMHRFDEIPSTFVTMHNIRDGAICEGFPITRRKIIALCKQLLPSLAGDLEYAPQNVLAYAPHNFTMLWWVPAGVRHLYFDASTHIKSGKAPVPPLVFRYSDGGLTVCALKEGTRPTPETEIWRSPFFNNGCMGDTALPRKPGLCDIGKLEDLFFRSAFTFHHLPELKGTTGGALWKSLVGSGKTEFPYECLVKAGTLKTLLKGGTR